MFALVKIDRQDNLTAAGEAEVVVVVGEVLESNIPDHHT